MKSNMKTKNDFSDADFLKHMIEAINKIEKYLKDCDYENFCKNDLIIDAVARELEIIGEASSNVSADFKKQHISIPFRDSKDMRNFISHQYFDVETEVMWKTCKENLPELKELIKPLLK